MVPFSAPPHYHKVHPPASILKVSQPTAQPCFADIWGSFGFWQPYASTLTGPRPRLQWGAAIEKPEVLLSIHRASVPLGARVEGCKVLQRHVPRPVASGHLLGCQGVCVQTRPPNRQRLHIAQSKCGKDR